MVAEIQRLQGEQFLAQGNLNEAKKCLLDSIDKNKKEAKTWIAYAKLNETVLQHKNNAPQDILEKNIIKGYFMALALQQHKARLIIPLMFGHFKQRSIQSNTNLRDYVRQNVDLLPSWLWLFWIPQLM